MIKVCALLHHEAAMISKEYSIKKLDNGALVVNQIKLFATE